jgi:hypothetical protein
MDQHFEMWIYRGAIFILLSILWYLAKGVLKELRLIRTSLQGLNVSQVRQDGRISALEDKTINHEKRIDSHANWIRDIETIQNRCALCPKPS